MKTPFATFGLALTLCISTAQAQTIDDIVQVEVLSGWTQSDGSQIAGLRLTLAPGWHTYWRAPGDAGIPPLISYDGSVNVSTVSLEWPVPQVIWQNGMRSIGYEDQVILPLHIVPTVSGEMVIDGVMSIGVCQDICVPATIRFEGAISPGPERDGRIVAALLDRPLSPADAGVQSATCTIAPSQYGFSITAEVTLPSTGGTEAVVIEAGDAEIWVSEPQASRSGDILTAVAEMVHVSGDSFAIDRSALRITVLGSDRAVDIQGCTAG